MDALDHLGNVLFMLQDLHADDRCAAFEKALAFYNAARPNAVIVPQEGYETRIVHTTPLHRALREAGIK